MPQVFRERYPSIQVIIDAIEVFIHAATSIQQLTFSTYKNHNTYKGIIGIFPSDAVTFLSKLYPGSASDKELTWKSGLFNILQQGDSLMADRSFDIMEDLAPAGVRLNYPPFLRGKSHTVKNRPKSGGLPHFESMLKGVWSGSRTITSLMVSCLYL